MNDLKQRDIVEIVTTLHNTTDICSRDMSFDYCYNYFKSKQNILKNDIEKSCLVLGFYLGSWGMFRNSFLQSMSIKHYENLIEYIASASSSFWELDLNNISGSADSFLEIYKSIESKIKGNQGRKPTQTLITKIMLGVFGCIPALDNNFVTAFDQIFKGKGGFRTSNFKHNIEQIDIFYRANQADVDTLSSEKFTIDFHTEKKTMIVYPKAKIIDLYGYGKGEIFFKSSTLKIIHDGTN